MLDGFTNISSINLTPDIKSVEGGRNLNIQFRYVNKDMGSGFIQ